MVIEVISACSAIVMVVVLVMCSCWKRERHKSEWIGLHGMVTQTNPDENVNHLPSVTPQCQTNNSESHTAGDEEENSKRATITATNTRRSLPDIPSEPNRIESNNTGAWVEPVSDNLSELYATVGQYQNSAKRQMLPNGIDARTSISQHSSISQADDAFSPYARVNYDKVHKQEHPYARVQTANQSEQEENSSDETVLLRPSVLSQNHTEPVPLQRSRRSSAHSGVAVDIPAATAVAGGIAANQELPYMTPPITQPNFSGDSQDSSKGYTSISVREPLANIRAQTKEINKLQRDLDPHYSTVSDDSDEMYTTIQDPNHQLYMSGSETYAQIQPPPLTVEAEVNPIPSTSAATASLERQDSIVQTYEPAPQPPSVDSLKHVAHTHSRQASSSSSVGLLGSPKPEKRQANSPLPPPPPVPSSPDAPRSPISKSIDDMYAKVHKNRTKSKDEYDLGGKIGEKSSFHSNRKISSNSGPLAEEEEDDKVVEDETLLPKHEEVKYTKREHDYETLKKQFHLSNFEGDKTEDCGSEPGYASINGPDSLSSAEPGYEVLKKKEACSEIDPNYEPLRRISDTPGYSSIGDQTMDGYSVINKQRKLEDRQAKNDVAMKHFSGGLGSDEPNYESMPSDYAGIKGTDSESDPNYESVSQSDPNYESVKYLDVNDPPYERLNDDDSTRTDDLTSPRGKGNHSGYETIDVDSSNGAGTSDRRPKELPYERLRDDNGKTDSESSGYEKIQRNDSDCQIPGYETIKPKNLDRSSSKEEPHYDTVNREKSGTSTSDDLPNSDEDIFEV